MISKYDVQYQMKWNIHSNILYKSFNVFCDYRSMSGSAATWKSFNSLHNILSNREMITFK